MLRRSLFGIAALGLLLTAAPVLAQGGAYRSANDNSQVRFRVGAFEPDGDGSYWDETFFDFTGSPGSFEDIVGGIEYIHWFGGHFGVIAAGSGYSSESVQAYRDFVDFDGFDITHTTKVSIASGVVGLLFRLAGPNAAIQPYLGGGGGFFDWRLRETGDFIDFNDDLEIFNDSFAIDGTAFGTFFVAGLSVPVGEEWALFAEGRWDRADDELEGDFQGLGDIDLSGRHLSFGAAWNF